METQRCDNCLFYWRKTCRRYPPVVHVCDDYDPDDGKGVTSYIRHPEIEDDGWCGEWRWDQTGIRPSNLHNGLPVRINDGRTCSECKNWTHKSLHGMGDCSIHKRRTHCDSTCNQFNGQRRTD